MTKRHAETPSDLAYLRADLLRPVMFGVIVVLYIWYVIIFRPTNRLGPEVWGLVLLAVGLGIALAALNWSVSWSSAALISGIMISNLYMIWQFDIAAAPYLLIIAVSLTGLLFGLRAVVGVAILCNSAVLIIGVVRWGHSIFSPELFSPLLVIGLVGVLSSLMVRNLYMALDWVQNRAVVAQENQEKLRDRQAELVRALKSLDVAYKLSERLNYDLALAREAAEEAKRAKQQFASNISHELRTPLNVIMAFSEMMYLSPGSYGDVPLPPAYRRDIREIYRSTKHLLKLTEDVLSLSRIEANEMKIQPESTNPQEVITEAVEIIRPLLQSRAVELRVELPDNLPPVMMDRARVSQVLLNLLNNARRFTTEGSITVQASRQANYMKITVADTGQGIPPGQLHRVFKEFQQLDGLAAPYKEGSGLGLAISKRFVEMHGGRIWAESEGIPGRGTRFHFELPLSESRLFEMASPKPATQVRPPTGRGRSVLLLDRDPYIIRLLEEGLEDCQIVPVNHVSELPRFIRETQPRAVVLNMARKNEGWQGWLELRRQMESSPLPVVLCPLVSPRHLGQALGVKDYLMKPVSREALTNLLNQLGPNIHRILVVDDDPRMRNLLMRLLETNSQTLDIIWAGNGLEGLQKIREHQPDLVLTDLSMPEMDGYTLLTHMQQDPVLQRIPVAIITSHTCTPDEERRLGGQSLFISNVNGFTNDEVLNYLGRILDATGVPLSLQRAG
jgi:signal transduction histidine kinase/DNA-binding response OmpR family regulator